MSKLWLLGLVAAVLVVAPLAAAYAEEGAPPARGERKGGEGRPEGRRAEVTVTPDQLAKLQDPIKAVETTLKALEDAAVAAGLTPVDAKRFVMQTISKAMRPAGGEGRPAAGRGEGGEPRKERKGGEGRRATGTEGTR